MKVILGKPVDQLEDTETTDISPIVREILIEQCRDIIDLVDICTEDLVTEFKASLV